MTGKYLNTQVLKYKIRDSITLFDKHKKDVHPISDARKSSSQENLVLENHFLSLDNQPKVLDSSIIYPKNG